MLWERNNWGLKVFWKLKMIFRVENKVSEVLEGKVWGNFLGKRWKKIENVIEKLEDNVGTI